MKSRLLLAALIVTSFAVPIACSSKNPPPPVAPTVTSDAGLDGAVLDGGDGGDAGPAVTGPVFFTDGGASPDAGGPTAVSPDATDLAIDTAIATAATKVAPKMEKEGQPGRATLAQGEHFNMLVTMSPGRCYTVVGYSPTGGVTQLDIKLLAPPLYNIESGKSGANDKNQPVLGKGAQALCPVLPLPLAYKVDVAATKGAGRIGVYVFAKSK